MGKMKAWRRPSKESDLGSGRLRKRTMRTFQKQYGISDLLLKLMFKNNMIDYENYAKIMGIKT